MNEVLASAYLDTLPAHPRPQPLESLNSYLKRIACANGIHHIATFSHLTGVREPERLLELTPASDFRQLGTATCCSDRDLLAMTVYFLGHKFGREQSLGRFLAPCLARHQRWCPACMAQHGYVGLPWSFLHLVGCPQHGLRLLDACPHCERVLRFTSTSLSLYHCPHCAGDLRQSDGVKLTEAEREQCQCDWDDLAYLLTPQTWDVDVQSPVRAAFRQRLGFLRRASGAQAQQMAHRLGLSRNRVLAIENETRSGIGETLNDYLLYVDALGVRLSAVFQTSAETGYVHKDDLYAAELLRRAQGAVRQLKATQIPVTQRQVGTILGYEPSALRKYAPIHQLLYTEAAIRDQRTWDYEQALCQKMQQVIQALNAKRERVTKRKVGMLVGHDPKQIQKFYPDAYQILTGAVTMYQRQKPMRQAQLLRQVERALTVFREQGQRVTQAGIADYLGVSADRLRAHASVRQLIAEQSALSEQVWLQGTTARVRAAMTHIEEQGDSISQAELAARLELPQAVFQQYPDLQALWQGFAQRQYQRHEAALLARVEAAMDTCKIQGLPLTFRRIAALAGLSRAALRRYPRIFALLSAHGLVRAKPDSQSVSE